jgi:hypothetical protein
MSSEQSVSFLTRNMPQNLPWHLFILELLGSDILFLAKHLHGHGGLCSYIPLQPTRRPGQAANNPEPRPCCMVSETSAVMGARAIGPLVALIGEQNDLLTAKVPSALSWLHRSPPDHSCCAGPVESPVPSRAFWVR